MLMVEKFLGLAVSIVIGKQYEKLATLLNSPKHVNEFIIAKELDITINQARNLLYRLSDHGLVSSIRKKDKKKGWYTYFWKIEVLKSLEFLKGVMVKKQDNLKNQIEIRETKTFYYSKITGLEYSEEAALGLDFICPESGEVLELKDNSKVIRDYKRELEKVQNEISEIDDEIVKENEKIDKKRAKEIQKEQKEKVKKKVEAAAKRKAAKEATKKAEKKSAKKKVEKKKTPSKKKTVKKSKK